MADRPILFIAPMVRAILDGSKTQTRRVFREQPPPGANVGWVPGQSVTPYGKEGDRLWVREAWALHPQDPGTVFYRATAEAEPGFPVWSGPWRPSIHMPRRASRITLEITRVRVERLQDISGADAKAEGCYHDDPCDHKRQACDDIGCKGPDYRVGFRNLWESINGTESWAANPWLWVVEFRRIKP